MGVRDRAHVLTINHYGWRTGKAFGLGLLESIHSHDFHIGLNAFLLKHTAEAF
jgi:hypothetical protein